MNASSRASLSYFEGLKAFPALALASADLQRRYFSKPGKDFSKATILSLERITWFIVSLINRTTSVELGDFFSKLGALNEVPTKSALSQARDKIRPEYFLDLFRLSVDLYYKTHMVKLFKGLLLWACDGTGTKLPEMSLLGEAFGTQSNRYKSVPSTKILMFFDVLNEIVIDVKLHPSSIAESTTAHRCIAHIPTNTCVIYDRGFAGQTILFAHQYYGSHCIIRLPVGFSKTVKTFVESGEKEVIITEKLSFKSRNTLNAHGYEVTKKTTITYRLVRVELSTGEVEVLMTSLTDTKAFEHSEFQELYYKRWGVETFILVIKSFFQLFNFSTIKENGIWQDIYAPMIFYNMQTVLHQRQVQEIEKLNKKRAHDYKPNRNVGSGNMKHVIVKIMFSSKYKRKQALDDFDRQVMQALEAVRPNRQVPRTVRRIRGTERHVYEMNYRRAS
jgi:hypothetical protein